MASVVSGGVNVSSVGPVSGGVKVLGLPQAIAKLEGVGRICRITLGIITREFAEHTADRAKGNIHNITGNLKSGTYATQTGPYLWQVVSSSMEGTVDGKNEKEYASWVEFGRTGMEPRFYMTRAFESTKPEVIVALKALASAIEAL
jgi:hypothetical protein